MRMISSVGRLRKVGVQDSSDIALLGHRGPKTNSLAVFAVSAWLCNYDHSFVYFLLYHMSRFL